MVDEKAARVFNILCEKIDGEWLYGNNRRGLYIWRVGGDYSSKKILIVEYHSATRYWDITVDPSKLGCSRMSFPHKGSAKSIAKQILAFW